LEYDDGESEWIDLDQNKFRILPKGPRRRSDDEIQVDDSVLSASNDDSFELESQAPADEYQIENCGRKEGKSRNGNYIETPSFRRVLQENTKSRRIKGKENAPSNKTNPETDPPKSAAGTHHHQDKEASKDNTAINMDCVPFQPSLFRTPSADLAQVAAFVERLVGQAIHDSSGTNRNSSIEKATKKTSGKKRISSIEKATGKKRKYSTGKASKEKKIKATTETAPGKKRSSSIVKSTTGKKRKSSIENSVKETGGKTPKATKETPRKKRKYSNGTKVREVRISVKVQHDFSVNSNCILVLCRERLV
jgi:hypothetical protein